MDDVGWGGIIIMLILCAVCPFLVLPFLFAYGKIQDIMRSHNKTSDDVVVFLVIGSAILLAVLLSILPLFLLRVIINGDLDVCFDLNPGACITGAIVGIIEIIICLRLFYKRFKNRILSLLLEARSKHRIVFYIIMCILIVIVAGCVVHCFATI